MTKFVCKLATLCFAGVCGLTWAATDPGAGTTSRAALENQALHECVTYPGATKASDITFTFDRPYTCGQYANGDWWVAVDPATKSVVIKGISPDYATGRNGWCVNPADEKLQPYDQRCWVEFAEKMIPALPYSAVAGASIVKVTSMPESKERPFVRTAAVLTVVAAPPAKLAKTFRPPYVGTYKPEFSVDDLRLSLLPKLAAVSQVITRATAEQGLAYPRLDYSSGCFFPTCKPSEGLDNWGTDMARQDLERFLWLCLDQPVEEKMRTLVGLVQYGIDLYGARKTLPINWHHGGGGNGNGRLLPFVFAATMLNSAEMKEVLKKGIPAEDGSSYHGFWEIEMFWRSPKAGNMVLWGQIHNGLVGTAMEEARWKAQSVDEGYDRAAADTYGTIDGGSMPGDQYQGCVSLPVKYTALMLHLIPELQKAWPEEKIKLMEYADRWTARGVHTMPDPYAPAVKLTEEQWKTKEAHGYGKTWGPDPAHPGEAIKGNGRFPQTHGKFVNSANLCSPRGSAFGEEMWNAYRKLGGPPITPDAVKAP